MSTTFAKRAARKQTQQAKRSAWANAVRRDICERIDLNASKVDRDKCIVYRVKVLGRTSPNRHGLDVKGTDYTPEAMTRSAHLYEGVNVNIGHPPRHDPDAERSPEDRNGNLFNVRVLEGEMYADWQLIPSHPMTRRILDCAENPRLHSQFALSHNAKGYGEIREGRYCITDIPRVRSVDLVCDGGTNRSLFEGRENMMKFKQHVEKADAKTQVILARLLEMDEFGDMPTEAPTAAEGAAAGWKEHLGEMVKAILHEEGLDDDAKIKKIMDAVELIREEEEAPTEGATGAANVTETDDSDEDDKKETPAMESKEQQELQQLRAERKARDLCESLQFAPTGLELKAIVGLADEKDRKAMIETFKGGTKEQKRQPHTGGARDVQESRNDKRKRAGSLDDFLADITV